MKKTYIKNLALAAYTFACVIAAAVLIVSMVTTPQNEPVKSGYRITVTYGDKTYRSMTVTSESVPEWIPPNTLLTGKSPVRIGGGYIVHVDIFGPI